MVEKDPLSILAGKIFSLLKGHGLSIKLFDNDGATVSDSALCRRFFVMKPNIMVTVNEEEQDIEFSKGPDVAEEEIKALKRNIRKLADTNVPPMNLTSKIFGKQIEPKNFSYQAKMNKDTMMENDSPNPINHHLVGQAFHRIKFFKSAYAHTLADDMGVDLSELQPALNRLVQSGKVTAEPDSHGEISYSAAVEEAVLEAQRHKKETGKKYSDQSEQYKGGKNYDELAAKEYTKKLFAPKKKEEKPITEVSNELLGRYKQGAAADAGASDKVADMRYAAGDVEGGRKLTRHANKRFSGIIKATKKQFKNDSNRGGLKESFSKMFGSQKTSQQTLENVRILVKHKTPVDEEVRGARSRHISAIFLECNGERFRFPYNHLAGARAMAQHMAHSGSMSDKVGTYISETTGNLLKLQSFNRYVTTNKLINEDSSSIIETVKENIETIRTELKKLTGTKTYETAKARLETFERQALEENDTSSLKDLFTIRKFDEKFDEVLPIVQQLVFEKDTYHKRIEEAANNPVLLRKQALSTTPMFEFASEHARLGFKLNEFALRIMENDELTVFVNKIGTKLCKEGTINSFERAVLTQVLENATVVKDSKPKSTEIKESVELESFFDRFTLNFF